MYITILICIAIIIISFVSMALFYHNKVAIKYIATSCIVTLVIEMPETWACPPPPPRPPHPPPNAGGGY